MLSYLNSGIENKYQHCPQGSTVSIIPRQFQSSCTSAIID